MPDKREPKNTHLRQSFKAGPMLVSRVCIWLRESLLTLSIAETHIGDLMLVGEEVIANIDHHGRLAEDAEIALRLTRADKALLLEITDPGIPFNPLTEARGAFLGHETESAAIGGLGVHLITGLTDHQQYRREGRRNILSLTKQLGLRLR